MRGCKYNLNFKLPTGDIIQEHNLEISKLCESIKTNFKTYYYLDEIRMSNQNIYNLVKRPHGVSKLLRNKCDVSIIYPTKKLLVEN